MGVIDERRCWRYLIGRSANFGVGSSEVQRIIAKQISVYEASLRPAPSVPKVRAVKLGHALS
jgi:hypothetical protein